VLKVAGLATAVVVLLRVLDGVLDEQRCDEVEEPEGDEALGDGVAYDGARPVGGTRSRP
jgi:hypothetical protein